MAVEYQYLIEDALNQRIVGDLPLVGVTYEHYLGRPGTIRGTLAQKDADANEDILDEGRFALYVIRDGRVEQGGLIDVLNSPLDSEDVTVTCRGWLSWFDRRKIRTDRQFTATDQFSIVGTLVADAQDDAALGVGADLGITVTYSALSGVLRDRLDDYRWYKGMWLGDAIRQLAGVENGFDFDMRYGFAGDAITKTLFLAYPNIGTDYSGQAGFEFSRAAGYSYTRNERSNVLRRSLTRDATKMAWRWRTWGVGQDVSRLYADSNDETKRSVYPMFDEDDTTSISVTNTLTEHAAGESEAHSAPVRLPGFTVDTALDPQWISLWTGDTFDVAFDDGFASLSGAYRIVGFKMDADSDEPTLFVEAA